MMTSKYIAAHYDELHGHISDRFENLFSLLKEENMESGRIDYYPKRQSCGLSSSISL